MRGPSRLRTRMSEDLEKKGGCLGMLLWPDFSLPDKAEEEGSARGMIQNAGAEPGVK